jgi:predicted dehydrogenase
VIPVATFARIPGDRPLRAVVVGAGGMGRAWLRNVSGSDQVELAGVVDLNTAAAQDSLQTVGLTGIPVGSDLAAMVKQVDADFVVDVTIPEAHHPVTVQALRLGLPVLGEKPMAANMAEAASLVEVAGETGQLFMVSQSRRYEQHLFTLKAYAQRLGGVGILTHEFFKAPHFGGFRDAMDHPLLLDMAIHNFDAARFLLDAEPVAVYCEEYNPDWSWYAGDAASTAIFEMSGGIRYVYTGSWCSEGLQTAWNSNWRVSGRHGSASWDGESDPQLQLVQEEIAATDPPQAPGPGIAGALRLFVHALRTGETPMGEASENILSLAMVYAAIESATTGARVRIADVLERARAN